MSELNKKQNQNDNLNNSIMILTIDIGNGICKKLKIYNINKYEQETYDFCAHNNLDFQTMQEINTQIKKVIEKNKIFKNYSKPKNNEDNINIQKIEKNNDTNSNISRKKNLNNEKVINRYITKPLSYITQRNKNFNRANSYGFITNNTRANTCSPKNSSINYNHKKNNNIISNVKKTFNIIKKKISKKIIKTKDNKDNKENINLNNNNNYKDINSNIIKCPNNNKNINNEYKEKNNYNSNENNKILFLKSDKKKNVINKEKQTKKRKESFEMLNIEEGNNNINKINKKENYYNIINNDDNLVNNNKEKNKNKNKKILKTKSFISKKSNNFSISERNIFNINQILRQNKCKTKGNNIENNLNLNLKREEIKNDFNNSYIKNGIKQRNIKRYDYSNQDMIINNKKYKEEKYKNMKEKQDIDFKKIYTFRPIINYISQKIFKKEYNYNLNERCKSTSRFEKLYNDRINFKENQNKLIQKFEKEFSYKPKINKKLSFAMSKISFNERLKLYTNKSKEKKIKIKESLEKNRKLNEYFKPKLNMNKNSEILKEKDELSNEGNNNDKYEKYNKQFLYGQKYEKRRQYLTEKYYEEKIKSPECCPMTNNIFNQKKEKCFKKIFKLLDGDFDGKISYTYINLKQLPLNIKKILDPIFLELKNRNEVLNENEFIFVCDKYYNTLKYDQKRELILFEEKDKKKEKKNKILKENRNYSFRPKINKYFSYEKKINKLNRINSSQLYDQKLNHIKNRYKSNDINEIKYIFIKPDYLNLNNYSNIKKKEYKKIIQNKSIYNNKSIKKDNNENISCNKSYYNKSSLILENLKYKLDKQTIYKSNDRNNIKIYKGINLNLVSNSSKTNYFPLKSLN